MPSTVKAPSAIVFATMPTDELIQKFTDQWQEISDTYLPNDMQPQVENLVATVVSRLYGWSEISSGGFK